MFHERWWGNSFYENDITKITVTIYIFLYYLGFWFSSYHTKFNNHENTHNLISDYVHHFL